MDDKIVAFPVKPAKTTKKPLSINDVEQIGFLNTTDRHLWVSKKADVLKIMQFIIKENITILEEE